MARPHKNARMLIARRCKGSEVTPDDPVDEALQAELYERARARILGKGERACAKVRIGCKATVMRHHVEAYLSHEPSL